MNLYDMVTPLNGEFFTTLLEHKNIKINRIISSDTIEPVEYMQDEDEWLVLLEGEALLNINNEKKQLCKGETLFIPSKTAHSVLTARAGTIWLTVHIF